MSEPRELAIAAEPEAVAFVQQCAAMTSGAAPVAALIYGRFSDEVDDNFRVMVYESLDAARRDFSDSILVRVPGMVPLLVESRFLPIVAGKTMVLHSDVLEFRDGPLRSVT